jgi:hypothetical protein
VGVRGHIRVLAFGYRSVKCDVAVVGVVVDEDSFKLQICYLWMISPKMIPIIMEYLKPSFLGCLISIILQLNY